MLHRIFPALLLLLAGSVFAQAQTFTLPEIGLQSSGACQQLAVKERASKTMVPIGCLDTPSKTWNLTPSNLKMQQNGPPIVTDLFTNPPANGAFVSGRGAEFSYCPWTGCPRKRDGNGNDIGGYDIIRAQNYTRLRSQAGYEAGETAVAIDAFLNTGYAVGWAASRGYTVGEQALTNGNLYEVTTAGTSASSGTGPSGTGTNIADGTVRWKFVIEAAIAGNNKVGLSETYVVGPNAGQS